jgi:hypothetical protein
MRDTHRRKSSMQLRKTMMMLTALSALSLVMTGCPSDEEGSLTCATDADCIEGEICHPAAKTCVQTCTTPSDCPSSARADCTAVSAGSSTKVCNCATDPLCNSEGATGLVCSTLDKVCTPKCTTDTDCGAGRTCDTATGQCKAGGGATCTYGTCATGEICGATTNKCEAGATCTGEAQSTCGYGQYCGTGKCQEVAKPTCGNLADRTAVVNFTPAAGTGSIIYKVEKVEFAANPTDCPGSTNPVKVVPRVSFYVKDGTVPANDSSFSGFFYVRTDKGEVPLNAANLFNYTKSADNKSGSVSVFLCVADIQSVNLAFYFTGGNGYCTTFTR